MSGQPNKIYLMSAEKKTSRDPLSESNIIENRQEFQVFMGQGLKPEEIPDSVDLAKLQFTKTIWLVDLSTNEITLWGDELNFRQNEQVTAVQSAIRTDLFKKTALRMILNVGGDYRQIFPYPEKTEKGTIQHWRNYSFGRIPSSDYPYLFEKDKVFVGLTVDQLKKLFSNNKMTVTSRHLLGGRNSIEKNFKPINCSLPAYLNPGKQENKYLGDCIKNNHAEMIQYASTLECQFLEEILSAMITPSVLGEGKQAAETIRNFPREMERIRQSKNQPQLLLEYYQSFITAYKIQPAPVREAVGLLNLQDETKDKMLGSSEKEALLRSLVILNNYQELTKRQMLLLVSNPHIQKIFKTINQIVGKIRGMIINAKIIDLMEETTFEQMDIESLLNTKNPLDLIRVLDRIPFKNRGMLAPISREIFGIQNEEEAIDLAQRFLSESQKQVRKCAEGNIHLGGAAFDQNDTISSINHWEDLLLLALGEGADAEKFRNDPEEIKCLKFEAGRLLLTSISSDETIREYREIHRKPLHLLERDLFYPLYSGQFETKQLYKIYDKQTHQLTNIRFADRMGSLKKDKFDYEPDSESFRQLMIGGRKVIAYCSSRNKTVEGVLRKKLQGRFIHDWLGKTLCPEEKSPRIEKKLVVYERDKKNDRLYKVHKEFKDHEIIFDIIQDLTQSKIFIIDVIDKRGTKKTLKREINDQADEENLIKEIQQGYRSYFLKLDFNNKKLKETNINAKEKNPLQNYLQEFKSSPEYKDVKIIDYKPTPEDGQSFASNGPGGGADIRLAKFYILYTTKDGYELEIEVQIFTPYEGKSAYFLYQKKLEDDAKRYDSARWLVSKHTLRPLLDLYYPQQIYGNSVSGAFHAKQAQKRKK